MFPQGLNHLPSEETMLEETEKDTAIMHQM